MELYQYLFIVVLGFIFWVEYSVGNIFFRISSDGIRRINISSLFHYMIHPLHNSFLWSFKTLDINFPFIMILSLINYYLFIRPD